MLGSCQQVHLRAVREVSSEKVAGHDALQHDLDRVMDAFVGAVTLDTAEGRRRMRAMRRQALTHDIDRWAHSFPRALGAAPGNPNVTPMIELLKEEC
jgi:hypothetical protein